MAQSLSRIIIHLIFSTKDRYPWIADPIRSDLHGYMAGTLDRMGCRPVRINSVADHVHIAMGLGRSVAVADVVRDLKRASNIWFRKHEAGFAWQKGYGAFSVGASQIDDLVKYIDNQAEHHRSVDFKGEYRAFLERYGIDYDERYVWD
ncbi:MAG: IS200/IS605 family transposase [Phycisphaerae bacterium]